MKPAWVTQALTHNETFSERVCDPACRQHDLVETLRAQGVLIFGSDAQPKAPCIPKIDFLTSPHYNSGMQDCICEPPDAKVLPFLKRALAVTTDKVCFLIDKSHLTSIKPRPTRVWLFHEQASLAWFVWDLKHPSATPHVALAVTPETPPKTVFRFSEAFYRR